MKLSIKLMKLRAEIQCAPLAAGAVMHALVHNYGCEDIDHLLQVLVDQNDKLEAIKNNEELFDEIIYMTGVLKQAVADK